MDKAHCVHCLGDSYGNRQIVVPGAGGAGGILIVDVDVACWEKRTPHEAIDCSLVVYPPRLVVGGCY